MDLGLSGKVAWVTGASAGLGRACALALAREGASVGISARDPQRLAQAARELAAETGQRVLDLPLDVVDADAIKAVAEQVADQLGPVDILIANAGGPPPGVFESFDDQALYDAFTLTTASAWTLTKAVIPSMRERGGGVVIFLTSGSTKEVIPNLLLSNMMRPAVVGMAKTLSKELAGAGIRVLCVGPGRIDTARVRQLDEAMSQATGRPLEEVRAGHEAAIPLKRYGRSQEFGDAVAFLASPRASYITGVSVSVDGGALNFVLS